MTRACSLISGDNICATLANRMTAISKLEQNVIDIEQFSQVGQGR